jgi:hypothetical protein
MTMTITVGVMEAAIMVAIITGGENKEVVVERKDQNEEVISWDNAFGVGICLTFFNDGSGRYKYRNFSATPDRICRAATGDRDTGYICLCRPRH